MNALITLVVASMVVFASAAPQIGIGPLRGWDDGQWHGEGLLESQDWEANQKAAIIGPLANLGRARGLEYDKLVAARAAVGPIANLRLAPGLAYNNLLAPQDIVADPRLGLANRGVWW